MAMEIVRDVAAIIALAVTFPYMAMETADDPVFGITILLYGQLAATFLAWVVAVVTVSRLTGIPSRNYIADCLPYVALTLLSLVPVHFILSADIPAWLTLATAAAAALVVYIGANAVTHSRIQSDVISYFRGRLK